MIFPDLVTPIYEAAKKRIKIMPCHTNRASSLGGICERELVYDRTAWEKAAPHDVDLQLIFEEGSVHEVEVLQALQESGCQVIEQQMALEWREFEITGHIDAVVPLDGVCFPCFPIEVKSMSDHIWGTVAFRGPGVYQWSEVAEAFTKKPWLRRYLAQLTLYCLMKNCERGILLCKNKTTGGLAQINVEVDYQYGEELLQKATRINGHVKAETLPERISFDENVCPRCKYYAECLPDQVGKDPLAFVDDPTLERVLTARHGVEGAGKEFDSLDRRAKDILKARPEKKISIGPFLVEKGGNAARTVIKITRVSS